MRERPWIFLEVSIDNLGSKTIPLVFRKFSKKKPCSSVSGSTSESDWNCLTASTYVGRDIVVGPLEGEFVDEISARHPELVDGVLASSGRN